MSAVKSRLSETGLALYEAAAKESALINAVTTLVGVNEDISTDLTYLGYVLRLTEIADQEEAGEIARRAITTAATRRDTIHRSMLAYLRLKDDRQSHTPSAIQLAEGVLLGELERLEGIYDRALAITLRPK